MHERAAAWSGVVSLEADLEREFEVQLAASSTLAFRVAFSVLRHREDAEDVAQEAFAKAYRNFRQLRDRDRFRSWLVRMTWRLALDRQRSDRRRRRREDTVRSADTIDPLVETDDRAQVLWRAIDGLSEKLRVVIVLAAIEGYDIGEVARLLDIPVGTVKSRLFLARRQLKDALAWMDRSR
jgi:RNA polymerase sigma-70 factor (ECF subfamily)